MRVPREMAREAGVPRNTACSEFRKPWLDMGSRIPWYRAYNKPTIAPDSELHRQFMHKLIEIKAICTAAA